MLGVWRVVLDATTFNTVTLADLQSVLVKGNLTHHPSECLYVKYHNVSQRHWLALILKAFFFFRKENIHKSKYCHKAKCVLIYGKLGGGTELKQNNCLILHFPYHIAQ